MCSTEVCFIDSLNMEKWEEIELSNQAKQECELSICELWPYR